MTQRPQPLWRWPLCDFSFIPEAYATCPSGIAEPDRLTFADPGVTASRSPDTSYAATTLILGATLGWILAPRAASGGWKYGLRAALAVSVWAVGIGAFLVAPLWTDYGAVVPLLWLRSVVLLGLVGLLFVGIPMAGIIFVIAVLWVGAVRAGVRRRIVKLSVTPVDVGIGAPNDDPQVEGMNGATIGRIIAGLLWCCLASVVLLVGLFSLGGGIFALVLAFTPLGIAELVIGVLVLRRSLGPAAAICSGVLGIISSAIGLWALANSSEDVVVFWSVVFLASSVAVTLYAGLSWRRSRERSDEGLPGA